MVLFVEGFWSNTDDQNVGDALFNEEGFEATRRTAALALTLARLNQDPTLASNAFAAMPKRDHRNERHRIRLWQTLEPHIALAIDREQLSLLAANTRSLTRKDDAAMLSVAAQRLGGVELVRATFETITDGLDNEKRAAVRSAMGL